MLVFNVVSIFAEILTLLGNFLLHLLTNWLQFDEICSHISASFQQAAVELNKQFVVVIA